MAELKIFSGENAVQEMDDFILDHEIRTSTKFVIQRTTKKSAKPERSDFRSFGRRLRFEVKKSQFLPIEFDGVPSMTISYTIMECHYGPLSKPIKLKLVRCRNRLKESKKHNCPAIIHIRSLVRFPTYKVERNTDYVRRIMIKKLSADLENEEKEVPFEHWMCVAMPGPDAHKNHPIEDEGAIPVDKSIVSKVFDLVACGVKCVAEMKHHITAFSRANFPGASETNSRFFPSNKNLRNHMSRALKKSQNFKYTKGKYKYVAVSARCKMLAASIHKMLHLVLKSEVYHAIFSDLYSLNAKLKSLVPEDTANQKKVPSPRKMQGKLNMNSVQSDIQYGTLPNEDETAAAVASVLDIPFELQHVKGENPPGWPESLTVSSYQSVYTEPAPAVVNTEPEPEYVAQSLGPVSTPPGQDETQGVPDKTKNATCKLVYYSPTVHGVVELPVPDLKTEELPGAKLVRKRRRVPHASSEDHIYHDLTGAKQKRKAKSTASKREVFYYNGPSPARLLAASMNWPIPSHQQGTGSGTSASTNIASRVAPISLTENKTGRVVPASMMGQSQQQGTGSGTSASTNIASRVAPISLTENKTGRVVPASMMGQSQQQATVNGASPSTKVECRLVPILTAPPHPDLQSAIGAGNSQSGKVSWRLEAVSSTVTDETVLLKFNSGKQFGSRSGPTLVGPDLDPNSLQKLSTTSKVDLQHAKRKKTAGNGASPSKKITCRLVPTVEQQPGAGTQTSSPARVTCRVVPLSLNAPLPVDQPVITEDKFPHSYASEVVISSSTSSHQWNVN